MAVVLIGCGQKAPTDPIDRVVRQESSNPFFFNGLHSVIRLPETASPELLVPVACKQAVLGSANKILETKKVQIAYQGMTNALPDDSYLAVLADTDNGRKVILFRYDKLPESTNKLEGGWSYQVYNE